MRESDNMSPNPEREPNESEHSVSIDASHTLARYVDNLFTQIAQRGEKHIHRTDQIEQVAFDDIQKEMSVMITRPAPGSNFPIYFPFDGPLKNAVAQIEINFQKIQPYSSDRAPSGNFWYDFCMISCLDTGDARVMIQTLDGDGIIGVVPDQRIFLEETFSRELNLHELS